MINIAMKSQGAIDNNSLSSINTITHEAIQAETVHSLNTRKVPAASQATPVGRETAANPRQDPAPLHPQPNPAPVRKPIPPLQHMVRKGQKIALDSKAPHTIEVCLGWNTSNPQCDVDVSAFLLNNTGKVPGDDWFVFYGQAQSPDHSTIFRTENSADREIITIQLDKLNPAIQKIVFVLTINEALEKNLHFGMIQDAYIRILNHDDQTELTSFKMDEYYNNVISMMIGEIYMHNGIWKFNAVGNGVAKDLSGLCALYGVQVDY